MDIKALIKKYEELWNEHSPFYEPVPYTSMVELFLKELKQLDEPHKVTIPPVVSDWIEHFKKCSGTLYGSTAPYSYYGRAITDDFEGDVTETLRWIRNNSETYARAWLYGYEVEKEKRYLVKVKGIVCNSMVLKHNINEDTWYMSNKTNYTDLKSYHTRKELEDADFGWVFDCPGIEIEEVE